MNISRIIFVVTVLLSQSLQATSTNRIFVTNERSNSVSVINGDSLEVEASIDIGERPRGIGLSPDRSELYVAVSEENLIAVVDPASLKILRRFKSGSDPETFAVHPNGNIYISNEDDAKATVFNPATGEQVAEIPVGLEPEGVAISPDGKKVIVTSESTNMLHVIAVPEHIIVANVLVGARPRSAVFNSSGKLAYATSEISGEVKKVDMESYKILSKAKIADEKAKPKDILLSKDESTVYVAGGRSNQVLVMDADKMELIKGIPVGKRVWGLAMSRDGKRIFTTDGVSGTVSVIDTDSNKRIKTIEVGKFPWGVVIDD
ncbi:MAG: PQQ-dependent catabolism-associated beta-propeller protein [Gammaproteobacteria bacterium]|jgi:PQQ-dependent catabolism-associated beta-propeller protein|nr:PQQ-dependent catabolism-associated beta-propeller protein [Gammaproteobacteria bacterium]